MHYNPCLWTIVQAIYLTDCRFLFEEKMVFWCDHWFETKKNLLPIVWTFPSFLFFFHLMLVSMKKKTIYSDGHFFWSTLKFTWQKPKWIFFFNNNLIHKQGYNLLFFSVVVKKKTKQCFFVVINYFFLKQYNVFLSC